MFLGKAILLFNYVVVWYLSDAKLRTSAEERRDSWLPTLVTVAGLSLCLFCLGLIPVDIYSVSETNIDESIRTQIRDAVQVLYYGPLPLILHLIPFLVLKLELLLLHSVVWVHLRFYLCGDTVFIFLL